MTDGQDTRQARQSVRDHFVDPLIQMGLVKKRSMKADDHQAMIARLVAKLDYMSEGNLRGLQQYVIRLAGGKERNCWPAEVSILRAAYNLQPPPPRQSNYAQSLIASAMGRKAADEGWLVELFQIAKAMGPPPGKYVIATLKEKADENRRQRARIREWIETGRANAAERAWLDRYHQDLAECEAIIKAGSERDVA
ncbi:MAG: hypothetical protein ACWA40_10340 [Planktomarina sp.]